MLYMYKSIKSLEIPYHILKIATLLQKCDEVKFLPEQKEEYYSCIRQHLMSLYSYILNKLIESADIIIDLCICLLIFIT